MTEHRIALLKTKPAGKLLVHEVYVSIQGESTYAGVPCVFVRLAVCDSRCTWCDTPHAFNRGEIFELEAIVEKVLAFDCPTVEITGGEPMLQPEVLPLMARLADRGLRVLLETSGAHHLGSVDTRVHIVMDIKCPDSGESARNCWENLDVLKPTDDIKFVLASRADFDWMLETIRSRELEDRFTLLASCAFGHVKPSDLAAWILESKIGVRMQLQMHKYIWDPNARGV